MPSLNPLRLAIRIAIWHLAISAVVAGFDFALYVKHFSDYGTEPTPFSPLLHAAHSISNVIFFPIRFLIHWIGLNIESNWGLIFFIAINSVIVGVVLYIVFQFSRLFHHKRSGHT